MQRTRDWRRAQTDRYKAKQYRDVANLSGRDEADRRAREVGYSDTRHALDCGRRCLMCHGDKLLDGHKPARQEARREIEQQIAAI